VTAVSTITHPEFGEIRSTVQDGMPCFVARDVCAVLDITKYRDVVADLDEDEKGRPLQVDTLGGPQEMATVTEPGLYQLIFRSRKPEAKAFRRWLAHEVLPALRRYGKYDPASIRTQVLDQPEFVAELPKRAGGSAWPPVLEALRDRPGEWARVAFTQDGDRAGRVAAHLRSRKLAVPPGRWSFAARTVEDGRGAVFARYLGPEVAAS
jgi:prophage antirepressor-like protein